MMKTRMPEQPLIPHRNEEASRRGRRGHRPDDASILGHMDDGSRTLRGLLGVGTLWALSWGAIGAVVGAVIGVVSPEIWRLVDPIVEWGSGMGAYGFVSGVGFGGVLALRERRKRVEDLSTARSALWGVLGSVAVPPLFGFLGMFDQGTNTVDVLQAMALTGVLGGTFAAGSVAIARAARGTLPAEAGEEERAGDSTAPRLEPARTEEPGVRRTRTRQTESR
jgi:hypothetical protein